jgi:hypothetical protein
MKKLFIAALIALPSTAFTQVMTETVYNCNFWTNQNGYYVCSSYPFSKQVVDPMSLNMKIRELEKRISDLEKKLQGVQALQNNQY